MSVGALVKAKAYNHHVSYRCCGKGPLGHPTSRAPDLLKMKVIHIHSPPNFDAPPGNNHQSNMLGRRRPSNICA